MDGATNNSTNTSTEKYELHPEAASLLHKIAYDPDPEGRVAAFETFMVTGLSVRKGEQHG